MLRKIFVTRVTLLLLFFGMDERVFYVPYV